VRAGLPAPLADGIVAGLMAGYLAYALIHDAVHHRRARPGSWLHGAKLRHARHHRPGPASDFGVSTGVWDRVFATASPEESGAEGHQRVVTRP
jgi:sterol desaturase/sphingolipid hydroxylase (fatty acid hydroxylase superfamily)